MIKKNRGRVSMKKSMSNFYLRLPDYLYDEVREIAEEEGTSMTAIINIAIIHYVAAKKEELKQ